MKRLSFLALLSGDVIAIIFLSLIIGIQSIPLWSVAKWASLSLLVGATWFFVNGVRNTFSPSPKVHVFLKELLLSWSVTAGIAGILKHFLIIFISPTVYGAPGFSLVSVIVMWLYGLIIICGWRCIYQGVSRIILLDQLHPIRILTRLVGISIAIGLVLLWAPSSFIHSHYSRFILSSDQITDEPVAVVFGSGITDPELPSAVMYDRVAMAVNLYLSGKVGYVILSGGSRDH